MYAKIHTPKHVKIYNCNPSTIANYYNIYILIHNIIIYLPPPAAPPLIPNVGPCDGCRIHAKHCLSSIAPNACAKPIVVADLPSPRGVGLIP